jgi:oxalate decarboxylase/phosphoglucose isomerase-like protein (cupin superfamily)
MAHYWVSEGEARITVFAAQANARTFNYQAGDIGTALSSLNPGCY